MADKVITQENINDNVVNFVRQFEDDGWGTQLEMVGLPKKFDSRAMEDILLNANKAAFDLMAAATGIAYLRGNATITQYDVITAVEMKKKGVERVLQPGENAEVEEW